MALTAAATRAEDVGCSATADTGTPRAARALAVVGPMATTAAWDRIRRAASPDATNASALRGEAKNTRLKAADSSLATVPPSRTACCARYAATRRTRAPRA